MLMILVDYIDLFIFLTVIECLGLIKALKCTKAKAV